MMEGDRSHALFQAARNHMSRGNPRGAVEILKNLLGGDPNHADGHALLAFCLYRDRRLHAAEHEASLALSLEPESTFALSALAAVRTAQRKFDEARKIWEQILEMDPNHSRALRSLASISDLEGDRRQAREHLNKALELSPEDPDLHIDLAEHDIRDGDYQEAEGRLREILSQVPEHPDGLVAMGDLLLRQGKIQEAREHAVWVLRNIPNHEGALELITAVKARESKLLGLWWRYSIWMGRLGDGRAILVLLGAFVLYRFGVITAELRENEGLAELIQLFWLMIVAYTWIGPGLFQHTLKKELGEIELKEDF